MITVTRSGPSVPAFRISRLPTYVRGLSPQLYPKPAPSGGRYTVAPRRVPMKEGRVVSACLSAASITSSPSSQGAPRGDRRESPSDHFEDEMRVRTPVPDGCTRIYRGRAFKHTAV